MSAPGAGALRLARPDDDAAIRALLRRSVLDGAIRLAFTREPTYAAGEGLAGSRDVTVVGERGSQVVAMGRCSVQPLIRNGAPARVAYLAELRLDRSGASAVWAMRVGFAMLADESAAMGAEGVVTVIGDDNLRARTVLEHGGRLGLPSYREIARLVTLAVPVRTARGHASPPPADLDELTTFLAAESRGGHLALAWDEARWGALAAHGVQPADACVVRRDGRIAAAAVLWDQRAFRQTVVDGYAPGMAAMRPVVNLWGRLTGGAVLPAPGATLAQGMVLSPHCADPASPQDWAALWAALRAKAAARGLAWLMCTRDERDPSLAAIRRVVRAREYRTTLYAVRWKDRRHWHSSWDARCFRPEAALL